VDDRLIEASDPDGRRPRHMYDAFGRRVAKTLTVGQDGDGAVETVWYTGDGARLAEQIRAGAEGRVVVAPGPRVRRSGAEARSRFFGLRRS
jgi:YD repeat-containing protein